MNIYDSPIHASTQAFFWQVLCQNNYIKKSKAH